MSTQPQARPDQFLSKASVIEQVGLSGSTIDRMEARGEFPRRIHISPRRVVWRQSDLQRWIGEKPATGLGHATA